MLKNIVLALSVVFVLFAVYCTLELSYPLKPVEPLMIEITKGMSFRDITNLLSERGLIRDPNVFIAIGRVTGLHKRIVTGTYYYSGTMSPWEVFMNLRLGKVVPWEVTIVEGDTLDDIRAKLAAEGLAVKEDFDRAVKDRAVKTALNIDAPSLEGYLFPDTYRIAKGMKVEDVLKIMVKRMRDKFGPELREKAAAKGMDERAVLTLASIIEKEASTDAERALVSAVYHNRLKKGMPLQADPTCIYGVKPQREGICLSDLKRNTPYNTYIIKGLPPGPIASPGLKSVRAAIYPANVPYLYFVSNNDGTHTFSISHEQHLIAVDKYRKARSLEASLKEESQSKN